MDLGREWVGLKTTLERRTTLHALRRSRGRWWAAATLVVRIT